MLAQLIVKCSFYYNYTLMPRFVVAEEIAERVVLSVILCQFCKKLFLKGNNFDLKWHGGI